MKISTRLFPTPASGLISAVWSGQDEKAKERCARCDQEACRRASSMHDTYIYQCHAGLTEAITPIYLSSIVIGYLFFGHVFSYPDHETGWQIISEKCRLLPVDSEKLKAACKKLTPMNADYIPIRLPPPAGRGQLPVPGADGYPAP